MTPHYIWMSSNPHLRTQLRRANEERSAAFYAAAGSVRRALAAGTSAISRALRRIKRNHNERMAIRQLHALDDRMLSDIGLPRSEIRSVARALAHGGDEARPLAEIQAQVSAASPREAWRPTVLDGGRGDDEPNAGAAERAVPVERPFGTNRVAGCG